MSDAYCRFRQQGGTPSMGAGLSKVSSREIQIDSETTLFVRKTEPVLPVANPKYLLLTHGACEHSGRYERFLTQAAQFGWTTIATDLRGHGQSSGHFVHVNRFNDYCEDILKVLDLEELPSERTVVCGVSMGGLVTLRTLALHRQRTGKPLAQGTILISPLLGIKHPIESWKVLGSRFLELAFPKTKFRSTLNISLLTHDPELVQSKRDDPLIRRYVSARWFWEMQRAIDSAFEDIHTIQEPVLLFQSGHDYVVDPMASKAWADRVNRHQDNESHVQFELLRGWYHEVLNEPQGPVIGEAILDFADHVIDPLGTSRRKVG